MWVTAFVVVEFAEGLGVVSVVFEVLGQGDKVGLFGAIPVEAIGEGVGAGGFGAQAGEEGDARGAALGGLAVGAVEEGAAGG